MTTLDLSQERVELTSPPTQMHRPEAYELTYLYDAPRAIARANALGSFLLMGNVQDGRVDILTRDLHHVAEHIHSNDATVVRVNSAYQATESINHEFKRRSAIVTDRARLIIVNNLDKLIGEGEEEPTDAQQFAIDSLFYWTTHEDDPNYPKRKICAIIKRPEMAVHPLRTKLLDSFAGKDKLVGPVYVKNDINPTSRIPIAS